MCGICGQLNFNQKEVRPENIQKMTDSLTHRGPDDLGIYIGNVVGLGHRRLSIIDLSPNGKQPMWSNNKLLCITFNGEVYNYKDIKEELLKDGYHFRSDTDTEVVVNSIQRWGLEEALSKFIGMFAFAVYDVKNKLLYLCRDRAGIKPLFYYKDNQMLLFGSELKSLMRHPDFPRKLDFTGLGQYFVTGYFLNDTTVFHNTHKLVPGHYMVISESGASEAYKYWDLDKIERNSYSGNYEDALLELEELLTSSFSYRLVSDVPVGLFLSGGIDSSLLSAILTKNLGREILNLTIGFEEEKFDETPKAKIVSRTLGAQHRIHYVTTQEVQDCLLKFCEIFDEPFGDTSGIPTYILSKIARQHVKVALSADGGDEQFCGYENYLSYADNYAFLSKFPWLLRFAGAEILSALPYRRWLSWKAGKVNGMSYFPQVIARYEKMLSLLTVSDKSALIRLMNQKAWSKDNINHLIHKATPDIFENTPLSRDHLVHHGQNLMDAMMRTDYNAFLRDDILVKVDRASMFVSLECRDPFLDHRIAEFAYSLPLDFVFHQGVHKRILKDLLRKWVGEEVVSAPKRGFMIPLYYWLKGIWKPIVMDYLSREKVKAIGVLDANQVERTTTEFYKYHGNRAEKIWMMLNFQMWAEKWYQ
jgi:asparagine synthase (glutamine-hydrolysing)